MKFGTANPYSTELYRAQTASSLPLSLNRKRCVCGKVATAKQLAQYGACDACARITAANTQKEAA